MQNPMEECPACNNNFANLYSTHQYKVCPHCQHDFISADPHRYYPQMVDDRFFKDYMSPRHRMDMVKNELGLLDPHQLREYLQNNAEQLIQHDRQNTRL